MAEYKETDAVSLASNTVSDYNVTMQDSEGNNYYPKTKTEQIEGTMPVTKGGTGLSSVSGGKVLVTTSNGMKESSVTETELGYLSGLKGKVQDQINSKTLVFTNVSVATSSWSSDATYSSYPYKATISCSGVTADYLPIVVFSVTDSQSNIFCPDCSSDSNSVTIYANKIPSGAITIPSIVCINTKKL